MSATLAPAPPRRSSGGGGDEAPVYRLSAWVIKNMMTPMMVLVHCAVIAPLHFRVMPHMIDRVSSAQRAASSPPAGAAALLSFKRAAAAPPMPPGPLLPDFRLFGFSAETLDATFAAYGPVGRLAYRDYLTVDLPYAAAWALFFGDVLAIAAKLAGVRSNPWRSLHLLPWLAAAFDVVEDAFLGMALCAFDPATGRVEPGVVRGVVSFLASAACSTKWAVLAAFVVGLALTLGRLIIRLGLFLGSYVCGRRGGGGGGGPPGRGGRRGPQGRRGRSHRHGGGGGDGHDD
jgi:hypothetical protein